MYRWTATRETVVNRRFSCRHTEHTDHGCQWDEFSYHQRGIEGTLPRNRRWKRLVTLDVSEQAQHPRTDTPLSCHSENCESVCVESNLTRASVLFWKLWVENLRTGSSKIRLIPCRVIYALQHPPHDLFQILPRSLLLLQWPLHLLVLLGAKTR